MIGARPRRVRTPIPRLAAALAVGAAWCLAAADDPSAPALVSGASAALLAEACAGCHGTDGVSVGPATPSLAGMDARYFSAQMQSFRDDAVYSTIMGRISKGYSDEEIARLAGYFQGKPFTAAAQTFDTALVGKGRRLHEAFCAKCHGEGGARDGKRETSEQCQSLAGQWTPYLLYAMADFRAQRREGPKRMATKLNELIAREGDAGLTALFAFYAGANPRPGPDAR